MVRVGTIHSLSLWNHHDNATVTTGARRSGWITHWSARFLAAELGISFATVARTWRKWGIQPHRLETFKFSTDPELEAKIRDVVGLYLSPPPRPSN